MSSRDLTKQFADIRQAAKARRGPRPATTPASVDVAANVSGDTHLLNDPEKGGPDWSAARQQLPPKWVDIVDKVDDLTKRIQVQMKELSVLHRKRLLVTFDDSAEATEERAIQEKTDGLTSMFHEADKTVMQVGKQTGDESESELRVRKNIQRSLAFKLNQLSTEFRAAQKEYLNKLRAQKEGDGNFDFLKQEDASKQQQGDGGVVDTGFNAMQMAALDNMDMIVNERDSEIKQIAQSIQELASVMKHLQELVIDQGTILDRIDYNIDAAVDKVKAGVDELEKAEKIQKDGTALKCIIVLMALVFILILAIVIKHSIGGRKR